MFEFKFSALCANFKSSFCERVFSMGLPTGADPGMNPGIQGVRPPSASVFVAGRLIFFRIFIHFRIVSCANFQTNRILSSMKKCSGALALDPFGGSAPWLSSFPTDNFWIRPCLSRLYLKIILRVV